MKNILLFFYLFAQSVLAFAQENQAATDSLVDNKYREDQFYVAITFNLLVNKPGGVSQNGFSGGLHFGFIRDMPINQRRNVALGIGGGLSMNTYNENLFIGEDNSENTIFTVIPSTLEYNKNWFTTYQLEAPIQLRWRSSTASSFNFWRVYAGLQVGYVYAYKANFEQEANKVIQTDIPEFDRFKLGTTASFGYGTFNFYFYYSLNPLFKNATTDDGRTIDLNTFKLGLIFYIL